MTIGNLVTKVSGKLTLLATRVPAKKVGHRLTLIFKEDWNPRINDVVQAAAYVLLCVVVLSVGRAAVADEPVDFVRDVEPIFAAHCTDCHGPDEQESQFRLDRRSTLLSGGDSGEAAVVPGDPERSFLVKLIRHLEPGMEMPPDDSLSDEEIQLIEKWIKSGAPTPEIYGGADDEIELTHWSFLPVQRPVTADNIDGFIDNKLADHGLTRSDQADRRTLIRRLYLVMLGIPPTPARSRPSSPMNDPTHGNNWLKRSLRVPTTANVGPRIGLTSFALAKHTVLKRTESVCTLGPIAIG